MRLIHLSCYHFAAISVYIDLFATLDWGNCPLKYSEVW